jgi:hypothetical protein
MKDHVPAGADQPGTLYVRPDGSVYRLRRYAQTIAELMAYEGENSDAEVPWSPTYDVFTSGGGAAGGVTMPDDAVKMWTPDEGAPSVWLIVKSQEYDGWNGPSWQNEDPDDSAARGYFASKDAALTWVEDEKKRIVAKGRADHDAELATKNAESEARHAAKCEIDEVKIREYDALVAAGISPSFQRPAVRGPFRPQASRFDEQVYLRGEGLDWEVVEVPANERKEAT